MNSDTLLEKILEKLDERDRIPDENDWYTVSWTTYGSSSLADCGSYFDKANNLTITKEIEAGTLQGVKERASWPGVHSIVFRPDDVSEESAARLLSILDDMIIEGPGYPCIDEDLAWSLELEDTREAIKAELETIAWNYPGLFLEEDYEDESETSFTARFIDEVIRECDDADLPVIGIELGPSVYVDSGRLEKIVRKMGGEKT